MTYATKAVVEFLEAQECVEQAHGIGDRVCFMTEESDDGISFGRLLEEYEWCVYFHDHGDNRWWAMPIEEVTG